MKLVFDQPDRSQVEITGVSDLAIIREPEDLSDDEKGTCAWVNFGVFTDGELYIESAGGCGADRIERKGGPS